MSTPPQGDPSTPSTPSPAARKGLADTQPIPILGPSFEVPAPPVPGRSKARLLRYWIASAVAVLLLAGAAASYLWNRPAPSSGDLLDGRSSKEVPVALRPYYDRAVTGDVNAMRMLGTMYYNGLNVPQDTKEGIRWYRKAAAAGSVAAAKDLEQLGITKTAD